MSLILVMKLLLRIAGGIAALLVVALIGINLLISADAVRDRVAARVKEQTGRELSVKGSTSLMLLPNPHIVITDASINDPSDRNGAADLSIERLELDLSLAEMLSKRVDAERVVMIRPVLTVRLTGGDAQRQGSLAPREPQYAAARFNFISSALAADDDGSQRDIRLNDVRIEDGTVRILYDNQGTERRIEHIDAALRLPHITDPLTAKGKVDWKGKPVNFDLTLTTPGELRNARAAKLELALGTEAVDATFEGTVLSRPSFALEGELGAKSHSIPSLLAWMREAPDSAAALGDGELQSHVSWKNREISFSKARFALAHASGQGQAIVTLQSPRPYVRAALAIDQLDLNALLPQSPAAAKPAPEPAAEPPSAADKKDAPGWFSKPQTDAETGAGKLTSEPSSPPPSAAAPTPKVVQPEQSAPKTAPGKVAGSLAPAAFDADINLNINETKYARLTIGPSAIGLALKEGVLRATLGSMELYSGKGSGTLIIDSSKPVPSFSGQFALENVAAQPFLTDASSFKMLSGQAKVDLDIKGSGTSANEIKTNLAGRGSIAFSNGAIEGVDLTAMIKSIGAGEMPNLEQGNGAKTDFSELGGSFTIASGLARSTDLQMTSPLLEVTGRGTVDIVLGNIDVIAQPQIVAGPEGKGGANDLAGLTIPVRIEGPLAHPSIKPEIKGLFSDPQQANKTVKQLGTILQKKFKGKPVGEALGRLLGGVQIGPRAESGDAPPAEDGGAPQPGNKPKPGAEAAPQAGGQAEEEAPEAKPEEEEEQDPELKEILR
jgi:AsmA protein